MNKETGIEIRNYLFELKKENNKLQKRIAKLEVKNTSLQYEIKALRTELKKMEPKGPSIIIKTNYSPPE